MALKLGSFSVNKIYLGVSEITKAYLGSTEVYSVGGVDTYAVAGFSPALVTDFSSDYYRTSSNDTTFDTAVTHARNSNATMVDSDGLLKWAPHNLLSYSEEFDNAVWQGFRLSIVADSTTSPDGTNNASKLVIDSNTAGETKFLQQSTTTSAGAISFSLYMKYAEWRYVQLVTGQLISTDYANFDLQTATVTDGTYISTNVEDVGNGWHKYTVVLSASAATSLIYVWPISSPTATRGATSNTGNGSDGIYLWGAHLYRSDLGGMVDNPDRGDSYVPTTTSARYLPRRGHHVYNGTTWVNEGLLVESEQRVNLVTYSEDFITGWSANVVSVTATSATAPDGKNSASLLSEIAASNLHYLNRNDTPVVSGVTYCLSCFLKQGTGTNAPRYFEISTNLSGFGGGTNYSAVFDVVNGTAVDKGANIVDSGAENYGNGWYRCWMTAVATQSNSSSIVLKFNNNSPTVQGYVNYTGDVNSDILIYGAQVEAGSTPSSYIPNAGTSGGVTRAAETLTVPAANLPYDSTNMTIQMDGRQTGDSYTLNRWYADASNYITQESGASDFTFEQADAATVDSVTGGSFTSGILVPYNIASRHGSTFINGAVSGTALTENTTPTALPDLSTTDLNLAYDYMGTVKLFRVWANDLGDSGIATASITAPLLFGVPTISGNTNQGATLTATSAPVVIGTPTPTTTWQWKRNGTAISGATSSTYTLVEADVGSTITVTQTETNAGGSASATSAATDTIVAVPAGAIAQRDGDYILDRSSNYIEVRA